MNEPMVNWVDVVRSIVLGQALFMAITCITYTVLCLFFGVSGCSSTKMRWGSRSGLLMLCVSILVADAMILISVADRLGHPEDYHVLLAAIAVSTGDLGFILLILHIIVHYDPVQRWLLGWFKKPD